jgi:hypothetical protein
MAGRQLHGRIIQRAKRLQLARGHARIASQTRSGGETILLAFARGYDALPDLRGSFARTRASDLLKFDRGDFDVQVNAIQHRP